MKQIKIGDTSIDVVSIFGGTINMLGSVRNCIEIKLNSDYETVKNLFVDNVKYSVVETVESTSYIETTDEDGNLVQTPQTTTSTEETDKSIYCLSGDIVDHRDGLVTIYMGQITEKEELLMALYGGAE